MSERSEVPAGEAKDLQAENRRLVRENRELRRANENFEGRVSFFRSGAGSSPPTMIRFITEHKDRFGTWPICRTMTEHFPGFITSRGYRAARSRPASARARSDAVLIDVIGQVHADNYGVYGIRKMWRALRREGWDIGRDQVAS